MFQHSPAAVTWIQGPVAEKSKYIKARAAVEDANEFSWRAGPSTAEILWLNLLLEMPFKKVRDALLKVALRNGQSAEQACAKDGLLQAMQNVEEKAQAEQPPADSSDSDASPSGAGGGAGCSRSRR